MTTYPAHEVDPLIQDLTSQLEAALVVAQDATNKLAAVRAEQKVMLEKVASLKPQTLSLDPAAIDQALGHLEDMQILVGGREKIAADLTADPNAALRLLTRVATLSAAAPEQGVGLPKSASAFNTPTADAKPEGWADDGWDLVAKHGA